MADRPDRQPDQNEELIEAALQSMEVPVRGQVLLALGDNDDGSSVRQLSAKLREPERRVRYHLNILVEQGLAKPVREVRRRGVLERYYKPEQLPILTDERAEELSKEQLRRFSVGLFKYTLSDASTAMASGTFWRPGWVQARKCGTVDLETWQELHAIQMRALKEIEQTVEAGKRRAADSSEESIFFVSLLLLFEGDRPN
ncbi:MAG TPA: hypothetical protein VFX35_02985 [Solirubrobacterales bacterium]|nr:hypothetical protein [Solirubrobacterales bacterium]